MRKLLNIQQINKRFGGLQALSNVNLSINQGEIAGLIGPNGAGKSTLFNIITGLYRCDSGSFEFNGQAYNPAKIHKVVEVGIARTFQNIRLFEHMTVLENVMVARHIRSHSTLIGILFNTKKTRDEEADIVRRARELLAYVKLDQHADRLAKHLSYGDQRRLEIARALATEPKLLALDEPAAGMNSGEKKELRVLLENIRDQYGVTILLIEHDVKLIMNTCNHLSVLDHGEMIASGTPDEVQSDARVIEAYLGKARSEKLY